VISDEDGGDHGTGGNFVILKDESKGEENQYDEDAV
jgi:hypothetical protein